MKPSTIPSITLRGSIRPLKRHGLRMKQFTLYLFSLLLMGAAKAEPGPLPVTSNAAATVKVTNAGAIRFQFTNISNDSHREPVLIIFDRYDHTGAGVVYQVFATDSEQAITIPAIPAGKYYVTIQCKGRHHDHVEKLVTIKARKHEKVRIELETAEVFSKNDVVIPAYAPSFADMAILKSK
ncbi:MAG TPA: hypothetical protein VI233_13560 [Puia sp.]